MTLANKAVDLMGCEVLTPSGERLGEVIRCESDSFTVRKGHILPTEIDVAYSDIASTDGNCIRLTRDPTVFSDIEASDEPQTVNEHVTGPEAGYDFGGKRRIA
jgi:hypothetical protein